MRLHPLHPARWVLDRLTTTGWQIDDLLSFTRSSTLVLARRSGTAPVVIKAGFGSNHVLSALPETERPAAYGFYWYQQMSAAERSLARSDFRHERDLAARATGSRHIVPLLETGDDEHFDWYSIPHYPNRNLRLLTTAPGHSTAQAITAELAVLADVAAGLSELHQRGIVHRDLYQENILIDGRRGLVTDLGAARLIDTPRGPRRRGPEIHWPPEYSIDYATAGAAADVFSLAVLTYRVLFGDIPRLRGPVRSDSAPAKLTAAVMAGLAQHPADRPDIAQMHDALTAALPAAARQPTP
ncbi:protein kinase [Nocardia sp. NPDC006044]|uniref:protein kinase domain-containing protein n=1 Tax=Nocardia sp. NPDC006044 TaxID=3364306 RepID=UPI0036CE432D